MSESESINDYWKYDTEFVIGRKGGLWPTMTYTKVPLEQQQIVSRIRNDN